MEDTSAGKIKVGCGWWGFRELGFSSQLDIAARFGFHNLEIGIGDEFRATFPMDTTDVSAGLAVRAGLERGLAFTYATAENDFTLGDAKRHGAMVAHALEVVRIAGLFGVSNLRLFAGFTPASEVTESRYRQVVDAFLWILDRCRPLGISIGIETHGKISWKDGVARHENTISTDPAYLERLLRDLPEEIGFNFDPGNIKAVWPDRQDCFVSLLAGRINYCHLKDWVEKDGGWVAAAIGDGTLDYGSLIPEIAFDGIYLIEYEPLVDLEAGIQRSLAHLRGLGYKLDFA